MFNAEKPMLVPFMHHYLDAHGNSSTIVLEIGNEPNVHPAMDPDTYGWYFKLYSDAARAAAIQVGKEKGGMKVDLKLMSAGLWIFDGMPSYIVKALSQGVVVALGRISIPIPSIPTGIKFCGVWIKWPCGLRMKDIDLTPGVDFKSKVYTDARGYLDAFIKAAGAQNVDIAGLHFYPYIARDAAFGRLQMQPHIDALNSFAAHAASVVQAHEVWLTEVGNFNPLKIDETVPMLASPMLCALKTHSDPSIKRWYWFKNAGNDKKINMIPKINPFASALAVLGLQHLDIALGPLDILSKPDFGELDSSSIVQLINNYHDNPPQQGLYNNTQFMDRDHLSPLGTIYYNFATIPAQGAECNGSPGDLL
jgi:hypothetical protein